MEKAACREACSEQALPRGLCLPDWKGAWQAWTSSILGKHSTPELQPQHSLLFIWGQDLYNLPRVSLNSIFSLEKPDLHLHSSVPASQEGLITGLCHQAWQGTCLYCESPFLYEGQPVVVLDIA